MYIIAVIGGKHSGKTTSVEALVKGLVKHGYKVATVKHVSQKDFTIDTPGKDTWRHTEAGAIVTTTVAAHEMAILRKEDTLNHTIKDITEHFENDVDITVFEGFKQLTHEENIPKIVASKNAREALEASKRFRPIIAFVGPFNTKDLNLKAPYVNVLTDSKSLVDIVLASLTS